MKFGVLALDYDGTIAQSGSLHSDVREAIGEARAAGIVVLLVTGRILSDLRSAVGNLDVVDAVVGENGAVVHFPASGRTTRLGPPPSPAFLEELRGRGVPTRTGDCVVETAAVHAPVALSVIRELELPLALLFNRGSLMILPQATNKATGLREALRILRLSEHNAIAIGDAENDHVLLETCELGAAVSWGSVALQAVADEVILGSGPAAVADYVRRAIASQRLAPGHVGRWRLSVGQTEAGRDVALAVRGRNVLIVGDPGTGKSWVAGLLCEQLILHRYCVCVIDPEGDYRELDAMPGVMTLGGTPKLPEVLQVLRHPDVSLIIDLSQLSISDKRAYVAALLPLLRELRPSSGLPHRIVIDEAHYFLGEARTPLQMDLDFGGYTIVTYKLAEIPAAVRAASEIVLVTRLTDAVDIQLLSEASRQSGTPEAWAQQFASLPIGEAALLPAAAEAAGELCCFQLCSRLTAHVRHRQKYLDVPVPAHQGFQFTRHGVTIADVARTIPDFTRALAVLPVDVVDAHLHRGDFSRWIVQVFGDRLLSSQLQEIEYRYRYGQAPKARDEVIQVVRERYSLSHVAV